MDELETQALESNTELESASSPIDEMVAEASDEDSVAVETEGDGDPDPTPEAPAYTPNLKFKVKDQEFEFDEIFKPLATSPEAEAKLREFHEKYHGIEEVKKHRDEIRQNFEGYRQNYEPILRTVQTAQALYQRGDVEGVLETFGMDKKQIIEWARREAMVESLSPQARAEYDRQRQRDREAFQAQQSMEFTRDQVVQLRREQKISEINTALSSPEAMGLQASFDQRLGQGAFRKELIRRGQLHQAQTGEDKPASEILAEMIQLFGYQHPAPTSVQQQASPQAPAPQKAAAPLKKNVPVIPVTKSSGAAQVKSKPKTIDEMMKMRDAGQL